MTSIVSRPFGLYVHIPYCVQKCPYCDFNSYGVGVEGAGSDEARYVTALISELAHYANRPEWNNRKIQTIFFGGGTPSLFRPGEFSRFFSAVANHFDIDPQCEITLEANPGTVQEEVGLQRLLGYREAGFNRISFGSQSFSQEKLRFLGRLHSPGDIGLAFSNARSAGFDNINCDLIFGVANENLSVWKNDLNEVLSLNPEHLSAYSLTVERGTPFDRRLRSGEQLTGTEENVAELYCETQSAFTAAGFTQYEVSNYSLPGRECRHNQNYWRREDYLGLGAGAHSYCQSLHRTEQTIGNDSIGADKFGHRWWNVPAPLDYIKRATQSGAAVSHGEDLTRDQALLEFFFLRVRFGEGFTIAELSRNFDLTDEELTERYAPLIQKLDSEGLLESDLSTEGGTHLSMARRICLKRQSYLLADSVVSAFSDCV